MSHVLFVAAYGADRAAAAEDFRAIEAAELFTLAAVLLDRDADGTVAVTEHGSGNVGGGAVLGGVAGVVVGLFAPPLLLVTALGAAVGAGIGEVLKRHQVRKIGVDAERWLPAGSSAVVVLVDATYVDAVDVAATRALEKTRKAVDDTDYDAVVRAMNDGGVPNLL